MLMVILLPSPDITKGASTESITSTLKDSVNSRILSSIITIVKVPVEVIAPEFCNVTTAMLPEAVAGSV